MTPRRPSPGSTFLRSSRAVTFLICLLAAAAAYGQPGRAGQRTAGHLVESVVLADYGGNWYTVPAAINNRGEIAGWASRGEDEWVAFVRSPRGQYEDIAERAFPYDINNRGEVVGVLFPCSGDECWREGFFWSREQGLQNLGSFLPSAVNDRGDMAGVCDALSQACVMRDNVVASIADPGSQAHGINARGDVVGIYGDNRAFHLSPDWQFNDIGRAVASDVNDRGIIAGHRWAEIGAQGERAMVTAWTKEGALSPAHEVGVGISINRRGWVIAYGYDANEESFSFIWDPGTNARVMLVSAAGGRVQFEDLNDRGDVVGRTDMGAVIWHVGQKDLSAPAGGRR